MDMTKILAALVTLVCAGCFADHHVGDGEPLDNAGGKSDLAYPPFNPPTPGFSDLGSPAPAFDAGSGAPSPTDAGTAPPFDAGDAPPFDAGDAPPFDAGSGPSPTDLGSGAPSPTDIGAR